MNDTDIAALTTRVLWTVLALALVFGAIARRTRFCTLGAISDVVAMGDWQRARMWALAIAIAMLGFNT
ncbi:YeeE/YedE thiosulfate transporter family protein, partial [Leptospira sp. 96542]|nr:YeeE/YedE thiosulfate transporter family protein [Leptospira sp. 96542]